jgi:hypothetical protein
MEPVCFGWDELIRQHMNQNFPDSNGAINYNVDPRLGDNWPSLITLPVIGRKLYKRFGYIYNPSYLSECCDNEQTEVFARMNKLVHVNQRPIVHEWQKYLDSLSARNIGLGQRDRVTFESRKAAGFP